jgi:small conductance mechanosensitive channel
MVEEIVSEISMRLSEVFDPTAIGSLLASGIINVIVILTVFFAFYLFWRFLHWSLQPFFGKSNMDETTTIFVNSIVKYGILILGIVMALDSAGIKTSAVLASLGIVGLTIGFAARDSLSNLISGVIIFLDRPFVIGDLVEVDGQYGKVDRITLRSTRIITVDGKMLAVPNLDVVNKTVTSYTNFPHIRIDLQVTIGVEEDIEKARKLLLRLADGRDVMDDPAPRVVVQELNDYNILLELQVWIENEREHIAERYALREAIFNAFRDADINMPYETIQLAPFSIKNKAN